MSYTKATRRVVPLLIILLGVTWGVPSRAEADDDAFLLELLAENEKVIDMADAVLLTLVLNRNRIGCELVLDHFTIMNVADETRAHVEHVLDLLTVSRLSDKDEIRRYCEKRLEFLARWYRGQTTEARKRLEEVSSTNEHASYREIGVQLVSIVEQYEIFLLRYIPASPREAR